MDQATRLEIFRAQTANVRKLESAARHVRRALNQALRRREESAEEAFTVVYALLYCAWLEALFSKLVHTPYGFELGEIPQIISVQDRNGILAAWHKCIELGLRRATGQRSGEVANIGQRLKRLLDEYVKEPISLRNKIAHGQWAVALNSERTRVNNTVTAQLANLDAVEVERWRAIAVKLALIIEIMIESPDRSFRTTYWNELTALESEIERRQNWTRDTKRAILAQKPMKSVHATTRRTP